MHAYEPKYQKLNRAPEALDLGASIRHAVTLLRIQAALLATLSLTLVVCAFIGAAEYSKWAALVNRLTGEHGCLSERNVGVGVNHTFNILSNVDALTEHASALDLNETVSTTGAAASTLSKFVGALPLEAVPSVVGNVTTVMHKIASELNMSTISSAIEDFRTVDFERKVGTRVDHAMSILDVVKDSVVGLFHGATLVSTEPGA